MFFSNAFVAFLGLSLASASPLKPRDAQTILTDISAIETDVGTLGSEVVAYTGTTAQTAAIVTSAQVLNAQVLKTIVDVRATVSLDLTDSVAVTADLTTLTGEVTTLLGELVAKAVLFTSTNEKPTILGAIRTLQTDIDNLYQAIETIVEVANTAAIKAEQVALDAVFATTIAAYD